MAYMTEEIVGPFEVEQGLFEGRKTPGNSEKRKISVIFSMKLS